MDEDPNMTNGEFGVLLQQLDEAVAIAAVEIVPKQPASILTMLDIKSAQASCDQRNDATQNNHFRTSLCYSPAQKF
jgi:hypothetical protein